MQVASKAYRDSMNRPFRNRAYIRATIGVINSEAQSLASADYPQNKLTYFANIKTPFTGETVTNPYATSEQDFSRVDGSMYFLTTANSGQKLYNNGIVTESLLGSIYIGFQGATGLDIKGLTIDFGDCYPVDFTIENEVVKHVYSGNISRHFITDDSFDGTSYLIITPLKMVNGQGRLRIYQFSCGTVNTFTNKETTNYTQKEYVSPITETIPSMDMALTVDNQDQYYSPDNPESTLAYFEVGQEMKVSFGYDVLGDGNIEWMPEVTAYLSQWSATDTEAKFSATDRFSYLTDNYYRGMYRDSGISLYDLAVDVLHDAGITDEKEYFLDPYLKGVVVYNPMPVVTHGEALQIIANAGRCVLYEDRQSRIHMQASFVPDMTVSVNNQTEYSHIENILNDKEKDAYAIASNDFSIVDGSVFFMPENENYLYTGYVSESIWIEPPPEARIRRLSFRLGTRETFESQGGAWDGMPPKLTIMLEAAFVAYGLLIMFRNTAPRDFKITTYYQDVFVDSFDVKDNELMEYVTHDRFELFDRMEIEFIKGYPNARITIDSILIGDVTDYILSRNNGLTGAPTATRQNKVRSINVKRNLYQKNIEETLDATTEDIILPFGESEYTVYFTNPVTDLSVEIENAGAIQATVTSSSNYFAKILFSGVTVDNMAVKFTVKGHEYVINEQWVIKKYNENGDVKEWNNPLVSSVQHASDLLEWLSTHYLGDVEYQVNWRGDPRTDANDLFYLELKNREQALIRCYQNELKFNGAWSGTMKARRAVVSWQ